MSATQRTEMLPFTTAQFFDVFGTYNDAIWPMQIIIYALALPATILLFRSNRVSDRFISITLGFMWGWTGVVYHWLHFYTINHAALIFAVGFVIQSALFVIVGGVQNKFRFGYSHSARAIVGLALIIYSEIMYPIFGVGFGHDYPKSPLFGVTPCPITIFTFGCFLMLRSPVKWWVIAIPLLWSVIGGTAAFLLDVVQDWPLLVSGIATALLLFTIRPRLVQ